MVIMLSLNGDLLYFATINVFDLRLAHEKDKGWSESMIKR